MMTEKEAWLHLAELWRNPILHKMSQRYYVQFYQCNNYGLCLCINALWANDKLAWNDASQMEHKISKALEENESYLFPHTLKGVKQRVQFCLDRASEL